MLPLEASSSPMLMDMDQAWSNKYPSNKALMIKSVRLQLLGKHHNTKQHIKHVLPFGIQFRLRSYHLRQGPKILTGNTLLSSKKQRSRRRWGRPGRGTSHESKAQKSGSRSNRHGEQRLLRVQEKFLLNWICGKLWVGASCGSILAKG